MNKKISIISLSKIAQDGRVLRQVEFLSRKYQVLVMGYGNPPDNFTHIQNIEWVSLSWPSKFIGVIRRLLDRFIIIPFCPRLHPAYKVLLNSHCDAMHVNNWDSLPMAAEVAKRKKIKLVLDIHESYNSWYWGINSGIVKYVFRKYSKYVNESTTVVKQLVEQCEDFNLNAIIVMNIPKKCPIPSTFSSTGGRKIHLVHHGVATHERRTDLMVQTIALCDERYELHMVLTNLNSKYVKKMKTKAEKIAPNRVHFYPPYPAMNIVKEISKFDIGFFPLPPTNYNYHIALPNKLFEFIAAGLAVCIGPSPSMADIVKKYECGIVAPSFDPRELSETLNHTSNEQWDEMKKAARKAAKVLNAENEMEKVYEIYKKLFLIDQDQ